MLSNYLLRSAFKYIGLLMQRRTRDEFALNLLFALLWKGAVH